MKKLIIITLALFCLAVAATIANAAEVTLAWDANDPAPEGYRLFQRADGQAYDYTAPAWSGTGTTATLQVPDGTYAWVVRAYVAGQESGDSNEVVFTVEPQPAPIVYPGRPKQLIINFE